MGFPTKVQLIKRKASEQWYINFPSAIAQAMEFSRGETVEWLVEDKALLALRRLEAPQDRRNQRGGSLGDVGAVGGLPLLKSTIVAASTSAMPAAAASNASMRRDMHPPSVPVCASRTESPSDRMIVSTSPITAAIGSTVTRSSPTAR